MRVLVLPQVPAEVREVRERKVESLRGERESLRQALLGLENLSDR